MEAFRRTAKAKGEESEEEEGEDADLKAENQDSEWTHEGLEHQRRTL